MIERVEFTNFKALRDVKIDLEQFTVLVGPNGSGKTSVLQGLDFLLSAVDEESACKAGPRLGDYPSALRNSWMDITGYGRGGSMILTVADPEEARDVISPRNPDGPESLEEFRYEDDSVSKRISIYRSGQAALEPFFFGRPILLRLDHKLLTAPSYSEEPTPRMQPNGEGLASVLDYLSSNKPDEFHAIIETLRHIIPTVRALRFPPAKVSRMDHEVRTLDGKEYTRYEPNTYWGKSIEFDMENAPQIPAHMVSEGTLLVLGLLTAMMGPHRPQVILIDDLDHALHPRAQQDLASLLRELLKKNPDMQIIATSHSPYLLDHLRPEEVRLTKLRNDGSVACARLNEHPKFEKWQKEMTPGEFWSTVGESWVLDAGMEGSAT